MCKGVCPFSSLLLGNAPANSNCRTAVSQQLLAAWCNGVRAYLSGMFGCAPCARREATLAWFPFSAARWSADAPALWSRKEVSDARKFTSAPLLSKISIARGWSKWTARCKGLQPSLSFAYYGNGNKYTNTNE